MSNIEQILCVIDHKDPVILCSREGKPLMSYTQSAVLPFEYIGTHVSKLYTAIYQGIPQLFLNLAEIG